MPDTSYIESALADLRRAGVEGRDMGRDMAQLIVLLMLQDRELVRCDACEKPVPFKTQREHDGTVTVFVQKCECEREH